MVIGGLEKLSLSDFPGKLAAVVFTLGCNLRCRYCHNPCLVDPRQYTAPILIEDVLRFLESRRGSLQGVVLSGGEPTIHADVPAFLRDVRAMGYATKLDTNGTDPACLRALVADGLLDYVALDVKAPWRSYGRVAGVPVDASAIQESLQVLKDGEVDYEVRTTWGEAILSLDELRDLAVDLGTVRRFILQAFRSSTTLDPALRGCPAASATSLRDVQRRLASDGITALTRG